MDINKILSKSSDGMNKYLIAHTKMVINLGMYLGNELFTDDDKKDEFLKMLGISLALHDIGKCNNNFQKFLKGKNNKLSDDGLEKFVSDKKDKKENYTHNIYSWAYFISRLTNTSTQNYNAISSSILFHHVVYDKHKNVNSIDVLSSLTDDELETFDNFYLYIRKYIKDNFRISYDEFEIQTDLGESNYRNTAQESLFGNINERFPIQDILRDGMKSLMRAIVILSDRMVSSGIYDCDKIINNDTDYFKEILSNITKCGEILDNDFYKCGYDNERLKKQENILNDISGNNHTVISASAGFGKTLIGLLWILYKRKNRAIWVAPRNIICDGTYNAIIKELSKLKQDKVKVALFYRNQIIASNYNANNDTIMEADILVTNIDNLIGRHIKNDMSTYLYGMYNSDIIFDEFHEFLMEEPLFPTFIRLMYARAYFTNSKSLLLSATPMNLDCFNFSDKIKYYKNTEVLYGDTKVNVKVNELNDISDLKVDDNDSFVITNTVKEAQNCYRFIGNSVLIHSHYTDNDKAKIIDSIYKTHDKDSKLTDRNIVIGTGIIGVGLDVSAHSVYEFPNMPEKTIQTCCGRSGRFDEFDTHTVNYYMCINKNDKGAKRFINQTYYKELCDLWVEEIKKYDNMVITKNELYDIYYNFYRNNRKIVNEYYKQCFNKGSEPLFFFYPEKSSKKKNDNDKKYIKNGLTFRGFGNNVFITARYNNSDEWCDSISINYDDNLSRDKVFNTNKIRDFIVGNSDDRFEYPNKGQLKKIYDISSANDYTYDKLKNVAYRSDRPIPLCNWRYSNKIGLYKLED